MARRCFISFKTEDVEYKDTIQGDPRVDMVDYSLDDPIGSTNEDYIMRKIREENLADSTVTIFLIGANSAETLGWEEQKYIKRELQASLYHGEDNTRNGILGIVLPNMYSTVYGGNYTCGTCQGLHNTVNIADDTVISEFRYNYYIPNNKCHHAEDDRYCVLTSWDDFIVSPNEYIEAAFAKRTHQVSNKVHVYPQ